MENLFSSVIGSADLSIDLSGILKIIFASLLIGTMIAKLYNLKTKSSKSFLTTLALLPAIVAMVIIMVNGDVGTGVAVAGAFSLIRFRSSPGTAREIGAIFLAMASGITLGMGYIGFALLFTIILCAFYLFLDFSKFGEDEFGKRSLTITVPEDLNYVDAFDDLFEDYLLENNLYSVKSTNMGSMFKLKYDIIFKSEVNEKEFIDEIRCRNGNLDILITRGVTNNNEL